MNYDSLKIPILIIFFFISSYIAFYSLTFLSCIGLPIISYSFFREVRLIVNSFLDS